MTSKNTVNPPECHLSITICQNNRDMNRASRNVAQWVVCHPPLRILGLVCGWYSPFMAEWRAGIKEREREREREREKKKERKRDWRLSESRERKIKANERYYFKKWGMSVDCLVEYRDAGQRRVRWSRGWHIKRNDRTGQGRDSPGRCIDKGITRRGGEEKKKYRLWPRKQTLIREAHRKRERTSRWLHCWGVRQKKSYQVLRKQVEGKGEGWLYIKSQDITLILPIDVPYGLCCLAYYNYN